MKLVILDTNELTRDWLLVGLKYQLIEHMFHQTWLDFCVPRVVLEELIANHARAVATATDRTETLNKDRRRLGLRETSRVDADIDYREYLAKHFDERLPFTVLDWPRTPHELLVRRALDRTPPFDGKGGGYRDALVWEDVLRFVREGRDVALVSMDKAFAGPDNHLAPPLRAEVESLGGGSVELVRDFSNWLTGQLPWKAVPDLSVAVRQSRVSEFHDWYTKSDFQQDLVPAVEELGFRTAPYTIEILDVEWDGGLTPLDSATARDENLVLMEYELGQTVEFDAEFPAGVQISPDWHCSEPDLRGRIQVEGAIEMILKVAVLYGGEYGFSIDELSWHRRDGSGPGMAVAPSSPGPDHPVLFA